MVEPARKTPKGMKHHQTTLYKTGVKETGNHQKSPSCVNKFVSQSLAQTNDPPAIHFMPAFHQFL